MLIAARDDRREDAPRDDVAAFAGVHRGRDVGALVANLATQVELVGAPGIEVPVTANDGGLGNAWVCSPYTAYVPYAIEEIERFGHPLLRLPLVGLCRALGAVLRRADVDRAVGVNNWLVSTNLYPRLDRAALREWLAEVRARWPQHAIWFRSLNRECNAEWLEALAAEGACLLPSRQVYLFADIPALAKRRHDLKADFRLLERTKLERCDSHEFRGADWPRVAELYAKLYLEKYSRWNPAYGAAFMEAWHRAGLLRFVGFREGGVLQAVAGMFERDGIVSVPIVGYDTARPKRLGLYRLAIAAALKHAADTGKRVNLSAGAAEFKRLRGGLPAIEYSAVLAEHLPFSRRWPLLALGWLSETFAVPIMKRYRL